MTKQTQPNVAELYWTDNSSSITAQSTDRLYGAIYETQIGRSRKVISGTKAEAGEATWELPKD